MRINAENDNRTGVLTLAGASSVREVAARMRTALVCISCPTDLERFATHSDPQLCGDCYGAAFGPQEEIAAERIA